MDNMDSLATSLFETTDLNLQSPATAAGVNTYLSFVAPPPPPPPASLKILPISSFSSSPTTTTTTTSIPRIIPVTDDTVATMSRQVFSEKANKQTNWGMKTFNIWRKQQGIKGDLATWTVEEINFNIAKFVCEIKMASGDEYVPDSLKQLFNVCARNLKQNSMFLSFGFLFVFFC